MHHEKLLLFQQKQRWPIALCVSRNSSSEYTSPLTSVPRSKKRKISHWLSFQWSMRQTNQPTETGLLSGTIFSPTAIHDYNYVAPNFIPFRLQSWSKRTLLEKVVMHFGRSLNYSVVFKSDWDSYESVENRKTVTKIWFFFYFSKTFTEK